MKPLPYIVLLVSLLLCGGCGPYKVVQSSKLPPSLLMAAKTETLKMLPDIDPRHAVASPPLIPSPVVSHKIESVDNKAADTLAVTLPPPPVPTAFHFADGFLDNVWCLQSSTDLIAWVNAEPNPQAPQYPVWHWGFGDCALNVQTNLPPNTGESLVVYRWKGMLW